MIKLQNLDSLRLFSTAAFHLNFTRAAKELGISQSAMSQQIARLEESLGFRLFERKARGLELTEKGARLWVAVRDGLGRIEHTLRELDDTRRRRESLMVRTLPSFAAKWLIPRMKKLRDFAPELSITVEAEIPLPNFMEDGIDVAITYGKQDRPELDQTYLFSDAIFPVCAPSFLEEHPIESPADLDGSFLIHDSLPHIIYATDWAEWFAKLGLPMPSGGPGPSFSTAALVSESPLSGHGVALTRFALVADHLEEGRLVRLFDDVEYEDSFYIICPKSSLQRVAIRRFYDWMLEEAAAFKARMNF